MSTRCIYVDCPACEDQLEIEAEYEGADESVGIRASISEPDAPKFCPANGETYTLLQHYELQSRIRLACEDWEEDDEDDGPDYDPTDAAERREARERDD